MSALFQPLQLRDTTIPNRVWMPPMCQYSAAPEGPWRVCPATGTSRTTAPARSAAPD